MGKRLYYIDALRVLAVLLLIPFHAGRVFNYGELFYAKNAETSIAMSALLGAIDIWHMPLLFLLAGASSYFALAKRGGGAYAGERAKRLLVPLLFGTLVIVPPQMWYGAMTNLGYTGSLAEFWPRFFVFRFDRPDYLGQFSPAHLWFILFLFVISLIALPLMLLWNRKGSDGFIGGAARRLARPLWWLAPVFVLMLSESFPEVSGKNLARYLVFFLLGFIAMADGAFLDSAERHRTPALVAALVGIAVTVVTWPAAEALPDPSWGRAGHALLLNATAWIAIVACLGWGRRLLDRPSPLLSYSAEASYPFYILHQTVIVAAAFYIVQLPWGILPKWVAVMALGFAGSLAGYELVRRVPPLRFLFGMKPVPKPSPSPVTDAAA